MTPKQSEVYMRVPVASDRWPQLLINNSVAPDECMNGRGGGGGAK